MPPLDSLRRALITAGVIAAMIMQILNTAMTNVSLPYMQAELGATPDQISWSLTGYLIAAAIFMPLTGFLSDRFGTRNYLLASIAGFVLFSMACGVATNLPEFVVLRVLQGAAGAALMPLSQAVMVDIYSLEERPRALAIWSSSVMLAPIFGPTIGAWCTDYGSWRWTFFLSLPVGIAAALVIAACMPERARRERRMDWPGFLLLAVAIGGLQYTLDRGNRLDWMAASEIRISALLALACAFGFILHGRRAKQRALFSLALLADRNFGASCLVSMVQSLTFYALLVLQPILMVTLLQYPIGTAGLVLGLRGVAGALTYVFVPRLMRMLAPAPIVACGFAVSGYGTHLLTGLTLDADPLALVAPSLLQGLGLALMSVPASTHAFNTLPIDRRAEATGLQSLLRSLASSVGIAVAMTLYTRLSQINWNQMSANVDPVNPALADYVQAFGADTADPRALAIVAAEVGRQAAMVAMTDVFALLMFVFVGVLPLAWLLRGQPRIGPVATVRAAARA
ncbi:MAG: DHA2 family efflux MFS transporter permease subunit [Gammaproteobacteria bacterium]